MIGEKVEKVRFLLSFRKPLPGRWQSLPTYPSPRARQVPVPYWTLQIHLLSLTSGSEFQSFLGNILTLFGFVM